MVKKQSIGFANIGVGAFIFALGVVCLVLTFLNITPNQSWIISWINNYVIGSIGVVIGLLLLGYGIYTRKVLGVYAGKVERLEQVKVEQTQRLRQKTIALKKRGAELERMDSVAAHGGKTEGNSCASGAEEQADLSGKREARGPHQTAEAN